MAPRGQQNKIPFRHIRWDFVALKVSLAAEKRQGRRRKLGFSCTKVRINPRTVEQERKLTFSAVTIKPFIR